MPTPDYPSDAPSSDDKESFRVNVPMDAVDGAEDAPDAGYIMVKYKKDEGSFCLDLESAMLPDEQPAMEGETDDSDDLESALKKEMDREPADNEGAMAED